jgi:lysophospholipase L1-like esterase
MRSLAVILISVLAGGVAPVSPAHAAAAAKIMIVGDSISQGSTGDWTWRYRLAQHLTAAGTAYDLVGPRTDLFDRATNAHGSQQYVDGAFDRQHAAKWGEMIGFAKERIAADVTSSGAQLLLVHLGINDLAWGGTAAAAEASLRAFVANARSANPTLRMIFGAVLPNETAVNDAALRSKINDYNSRLSAVAAALSTRSSPINVLGAASGWNPATDTYDGTHPNPRGEYRIAANYADGLRTYAGIGRAFGAIPSVPLFGAPDSLTATPGTFQATLTWSAVAGATGYYVWQRNATAGQEWVQLPYPLTATRWTAQMLTVGDTWQYRIQPVRVRDLGGFSPTASVVPTGARAATPTGRTAASRAGEAG